MRRVVVTGLGIISPAGNDIKSFWNSLISGKCCIDFITKFDTTDFNVKVAAEVKNFDKSVLDRKEISRSDLYTQYALAAAIQAYGDSGIEGKIDKSRLGVFISSGIGGISTFATEYDKFRDSGPGGYPRFCTDDDCKYGFRLRFHAVRRRAFAARSLRLRNGDAVNRRGLQGD